jgi:hypothetical protein
MKLLVLVVRGLQAALLGPYGNRWLDTFTFDALAAQGVVFTSHFSVHPDAVATRRVWRTGRHQFPTLEDAFAQNQPDLLAALAEKKIPTRLISSTTIEGWAERWQNATLCSGTRATLKAATQALDEMSALPSWMLWVEVSALLPWKVPESVLEELFANEEEVEEIIEPEEEEELAEGEEIEDEEEEEEEFEDPELAEQDQGFIPEEPPLEPLLQPTIGPIDRNDDLLYLRLQRTYAAAILNIDQQLGNLLNGLDDDIHVLLTSDAGQALGEHGVVGPMNARLQNEIVQVPLMMYGPGCRAGRHVHGLTSSLDIAPTIAALAGVELPLAHGKSLLPLLSESNEPIRPYLVMGHQVDQQIEWALRSAEVSFQMPIGEGNPRLYFKPDDRWEVNDVYLQEPRQSEELGAVLREYVERATRDPTFELPKLGEDRA